MSVLQPARKQGKKFLNPVPTAVMAPGAFTKMLSAYMHNKNEVVPKRQLGPFTTDPKVYGTPPASGLRITWIGHSSLLIEIDGLRLLTDPVWGSRASFSSFVGPKRFFAPPLALKDLPPLDAIIISHDHYDHLDKPTIEYLAQGATPFYCSLNVGAFLQKCGVGASHITEMNWTDKVQIGSNCQLTALPARHFSGRSLTNRFETLWSSFSIKTAQHHIYFGADSGWYEGFHEIGEVFGPFDLTMLEIGAHNTLWPDIHMGPYHAADAHLALKGKLMMPIHWGTFNLALHAWDEPIKTLLSIAPEKDIQLFAPQPGEPAEVTGQAYIHRWWER
jgi:L-ascorbate metabolism protein UlaG (beta-lactamase superfamily)